MKKLVHIILFLYTTAAVMLTVASCGLIDFDFDEPLESVYDMHLDCDTVYVMVGDTFTVNRRYTPDIVRDGDVFWSMNNDEITQINDSCFVASDIGVGYLRATSVIQGIQDSCYVIVMPHWVEDYYSFPDEMILYAKVTIKGNDFNPENMMIAAYVDEECRGVGTLMQARGISYVRLRVHGTKEGSDGCPENVRFRIYYRENYNVVCDYINMSMVFDGETHGTLGNLITMKYK